MDNITHTLVGGLIGGVLSRNHVRKTPVVAAAIIASNLPDADLLYAPYLSAPFGYMLHHRGHTHTLLGAVGCAMVVWAFIWLVTTAFEKGRKVLPRYDHFFTVGIAALCGGLMHLAMDWLNTYGVHPFWPFDNHWYYGDTVFIVEPLLWISLSLAAFYLATTQFLKTLCIIGVALGAGLIGLSGKVPSELCIAYLVFFAIAVFTLRSFSRIRKSSAWIAVSILILGIFAVAGHAAISSRSPPAMPHASRQVILLSFVQPAPADPFCWTRYEMSTVSNQVVYRRESVQVFPSLFSFNCDIYSLAPTGKGIQEEFFSVFFSMPLSQFTQLSENCRWKAFLQFARLPSVELCNSSQLCGVDQRFYRIGSRNFTAIPLEGSCPDNLPPWISPLRLPGENLR